MKIGLVLEGGANRGVFTSGVLVILWNRIWERRFGMSSAPPPAQAMP